LFCGILTLLWLTGCATALKRESQCLASLTPEIVQAREDMANLEASWHESLVRRDAAFSAATSPLTAYATSFGQHQPVFGGVVSTPAMERRTRESEQQEETRLAAREAYERLVGAKTHYQPLLGMYDQVYQRVRTRTEEEDILSNVRMVLMTAPASLVFYPIIRWNVRSVLWDGQDPDAEADLVTQFCTTRLAKETASAETPNDQPPTL
jgi:hypothetical protein